MTYRRREILSGVDLELRAGEQAALLGRNGSGKTTLLQIMAGIQRPDQGTVRYFGHDIAREKSAVRKYVGYLPQDGALIDELSVQDNISLWSGKRGRPERELVEFFRLENILRTAVGKLSGGMKRRVGIACTVVNWPPILLMDEPSSGLDRDYKAELRDFLAEYRKRNGILVVATHDDAEIQMSTRRFALENGVLREKEDL